MTVEPRDAERKSFVAQVTNEEPTGKPLPLVSVPARSALILLLAAVAAAGTAALYLGPPARITAAAATAAVVFLAVARLLDRIIR